MTTAPAATRAAEPERTATRRDPLFAALTGLIAVVVLMQFVFAGLFLRTDDREAGWYLDAHAWGAHIGTVLAVAAAAYAVWRLRARKDLLVGSVALAVLFLLESYIGGVIRDDSKDSLTAVHVPIAFALTALVVWLPLRSRR